MKKFQRTYPPPVDPPSSVLSPSDSRDHAATVAVVRDPLLALGDRQQRVEPHGQLPERPPRVPGGFHLREHALTPRAGFHLHHPAPLEVHDHPFGTGAAPHRRRERDPPPHGLQHGGNPGRTRRQLHLAIDQGAPHGGPGGRRVPILARDRTVAHLETDIGPRRGRHADFTPAQRRLERGQDLHQRRVVGVEQRRLVDLVDPVVHGEFLHLEGGCPGPVKVDRPAVAPTQNVLQGAVYVVRHLRRRHRTGELHRHIDAG